MIKILAPTGGIHYREGYKGLLVEADGKDDHWTLEFPHWFRHPKKPVFYQERHVSVTATHLQIDPNFVWNFANAFPDFDWVKIPSMAHDALLAYRHWLISRDLITEDSPADKALKEDIDTVFMLLCKQRLPRWARLTPRLLFIGVNKLSRLSRGSQAKDHKIQYVA